MKKTLFLATLTIAFAYAVTGCGSKSSPAVAEAALVVTTTPAVNTVQPAAPGPDFNLNVTITSSIPPKGVTISVTSEVDGTSAPFFNSSGTSTQASNNYSITATPIAQVCVVNITVTSVDKPSNTWSGSYRYSAK